jgi:hypothetical protein
MKALRQEDGGIISKMKSGTLDLEEFYDSEWLCPADSNFIKEFKGDAQTIEAYKLLLIAKS